MPAPVVTEQSGAIQWMLSTIAADSAIQGVAGYGGAYESIAPIGASAPWIVVQLMSGMDVLTANGNRVYANQVWQLKAVGPASAYAALITLAVRLEALFGNTRQASTSNVRVSAAVREQEINYAEIVNGAVWSHIGGLYRLETQLV